MNRICKLFLALSTVALIGGCAGVNFKRPEPGALEVGKSTTSQIMQVMGSPGQTGESLRNGEKLQMLRYAYAEGAGVGKYPGVIPARAMVFLTHNNLMISEEFLSSFPIDATDFDESKVASIVKGKTTRQEVVALLGKPNGNGVFPFVKNKGETALIYSYSHAKGSAFNMTFFSKILVVTVGDDGIVSEVEYSSSGEK